MALVCVSPPLVEPVSLAELKEYCRIDADDCSQDVTLTSLALDARAFCETFTARRFVQQTWRLLMDFFPGYIDLKLAGQKVSSPFVSGSNAVLVGIRYAIVLPYPPVLSLSTFQYQDANGNVTVMDPETDFVQDLASNPARLTPPFGQMWPVARVVVNAVQIDYTVGYAAPVTVTTSQAAKSLTSSYSFQSTDVGRAISIPGAGLSQGPLNTIIASVSGGTATLRDSASVSARNATALLVNNPNANPAHWEKIKRAIKVYTVGAFENRLPAKQIEDSVERILYPVRDLRM